MSRPKRECPGGSLFHVLNRGNDRKQVFDDEGDYAAFERVLEEGVVVYGMRLCAYVLMPNPWHMVLWPRGDDDLSEFVGWVTYTHSTRWRSHRHSRVEGHVYQGRFKSFVIEEDAHFRTVCRYVERNPLRAKLVETAQAWRWSSLWREVNGTPEQKSLMSRWPVDRGPLRRWTSWVNRPQSSKEEEALEQCIRRGQPYGQEAWVRQSAAQLGVESSIRPLGRPRKDPGDAPKTVVNRFINA